MEFWLSLKSFEVHIAVLTEELLYAQDFLSTFQELNSRRKETFLHWEFSQVYFHIYFQLSVNKPFPKEKLPGKGNLNPHHSHQFDARARKSCCPEPGKGSEARSNESEVQHIRIPATAASTSALLRIPLKCLYANAQEWAKHKRSWRCAYACEGYDPTGITGK